MAHTVTIERMAHGGEGIGSLGGKVVFVPSAYPGDVVSVELAEDKKRFARARATYEVLSPSPLRVDSRCQAAAAGAGCCDFSTVDPAAELDLKAQVLRGQLERLGKLSCLPELTLTDMGPAAGWRSRVRLGVGSDGRAGFRTRKGNEVVPVPCVQAVAGLLDGIVGADARRFTPGVEVVAVVDDDGKRHVAELAKPARGRRSEKLLTVIEGSGLITQRAGQVEFSLPITAFWQAHVAAVDTYSAAITAALVGEEVSVAWDLYGGVGALAPALLAAGDNVTVYSVESSKEASVAGRAALPESVRFIAGDVVAVASQLPAPDVVLLDPPRVGAGAEAIKAIATAGPSVVVHIGCDPATFARDAGHWTQHGYTLASCEVFNAFPGTHHSESLGVFRRME